MQGAALVLVLGIGSSLSAATGPGFKVRAATTQLVDGVHRLDARVDFDFSGEALDAMENGVAITVAVQMQVLQLSRLWDSAVAEVTARYRIQAHALSRQYLVKNLSTGEVSTYRDFDEMLAELGRIRDFPLLDDAVLEDSEQYRVRLRATLDIESLPTPLRLVAYFKPSWRLSSEWKTWALER
jgi:hypothetical protein